MIKWVLICMMFGNPYPIPNTPVFDTETGCHLFLHNTMGEDVAAAFKVICVEKRE